MKFLFGNIITPDGIGPTRGIYGESGWLLEEKLMPRGLVLASWDHTHEVGQMRLIKRVVLEDGSGAAARIIGKTVKTFPIPKIKLNIFL